MRKIPFLLLIAAFTLGAQQPAAGSADDHAMIQQLLARMQQLNQRVQDLETEVRQLRAGAAPAGPVVAATPTAPAQPTPPPATAAAVVPAEAAQQPAPQPGESTMHDMNIPGMPAMQFRGFSDIRYVASDQKGLASTFTLGQFDLFITSKLTEKFNVLAEVVVEADPSNAMGIDLERLLFNYNASDAFNISAGRYHTAIGFYNTAYHHSTWLQTTVDRPFLFAFEDGGGILPIHNVGATSTGLLPSGNLGLHYVAEIGNGRTSRSPLDEPVQNVQDEDNGKAFNLALYARPPAIRGFQAGFSVYRDTLHPVQDYNLNPYTHKIGQTIYAGHVVYQGSRFEFLNEAVVLRHAVAQGPVYHIPAFYSQFSAPFGKFRPYFRYEYMNVPRNEPMFGDVGLRHGPVTGVRWDFSDFSALKLEYFRTMTRDFSPINGLRTQVSFTF